MKPWIAGAVLLLGAAGTASADEQASLSMALQGLISQAAASGQAFAGEFPASEQALASLDAAWDETARQVSQRVAAELASRIPNPIR